jgi:hypothetical protein
LQSGKKKSHDIDPSGRLPDDISSFKIKIYIGFDIYFFYVYNEQNFTWKEVLTMKLCFCRLLFAVAIIVIALVWWPAAWAKIVVVIAAAILALMSLFYQTCCCRMKGTEPAAVSSPSTPAQEEPPKEEG